VTYRSLRMEPGYAILHAAGSASAIVLNPGERTLIESAIDAILRQRQPVARVPTDDGHRPAENGSVP